MSKKSKHKQKDALMDKKYVLMAKKYALMCESNDPKVDGLQKTSSAAEQDPKVDGLQKTSSSTEQDLHARIDRLTGMLGDLFLLVEPRIASFDWESTQMEDYARGLERTLMVEAKRWRGLCKYVLDLINKELAAHGLSPHKASAAARVRRNAEEKRSRAAALRTEADLLDQEAGNQVCPCVAARFPRTVGTGFPLHVCEPALIECPTCLGVGRIRDGETNDLRRCLDCGGSGKRDEPTNEVTAESLTDKEIVDLQTSCMNGSPLAEDCAVALGDLVLDDGDSDDNIAMARDRIAAAINARKAGR